MLFHNRSLWCIMAHNVSEPVMNVKRCVAMGAKLAATYNDYAIKPISHTAKLPVLRGLIHA